MSAFYVHKAGKGGWCEWSQPLMRGYKMACCDCGLVHDMEFAVLLVEKKYKNGRWKGKKMPIGKYRVEFRARRNNRSTGQLRRHKA